MTLRTIKTLGSIGFLLVCASAMAEEYQAITEFPRCWLGGGSKGCKGVVDPERLEKVRPRQVDDVDVQACQAITDNINAMEKYHVNWECDFPLSSNIHTLSKPQWQEVTGEEKQRSLQTLHKDDPNVTPPKRQEVPVFGVPYNVDAVEGDEKMYIMWSDKSSCDKGKDTQRHTLWFSEKFRYDFSYNDPVLFASRLYFIQYSPTTSSDDKDFAISSMMIQEPYTGLKVSNMVCAIKPVNSTAANKE